MRETIFNAKIVIRAIEEPGKPTQYKCQIDLVGGKWHAGVAGSPHWALFRAACHWMNHEERIALVDDPADAG